MEVGLVTLGRNHAVGFRSGDLNRAHLTVDDVGCKRHLEPPVPELAIPDIGAVVPCLTHLAEDRMRIVGLAVVQDESVVADAHLNLSLSIIAHQEDDETPEKATAADDF